MTLHGDSLLVGTQVAPHERECERRLVTCEEDVERLDAECTAGALAVLRDPHGLADPSAVTQREHGDHQPPGKVDLVLERADECAVLLGQHCPGSEGSCSETAGVSEHSVQSLGWDEIAVAGGVEGVERSERHGSVGIVESERDDPDSVLVLRPQRRPARATRAGARPHERARHGDTVPRRHRVAGPLRSPVRWCGRLPRPR